MGFSSRAGTRLQSVHGSADDLSCSEVERAAKFIRTAAAGKRITLVETVQDALVYTGGITHEEFVRSSVQGSRPLTQMFSSAMR